IVPMFTCGFVRSNFAFAMSGALASEGAQRALVFYGRALICPQRKNQDRLRVCEPIDQAVRSVDVIALKSGRS
ncbi:MAG: hypothetical protein ACO22Z_13570, partial [Paracoccaceae bacterium]